MLGHLLTLLKESLPISCCPAPSTDPPPPRYPGQFLEYDGHLVQWLTLLLAHIFTTLPAAENNKTNKTMNIFTPVYSKGAHHTSDSLRSDTPTKATPKPSRTMNRCKSMSELLVNVFPQSEGGRGAEHDGCSLEEETEPHSKGDGKTGSRDSAAAKACLDMLEPDLVGGVSKGLAELLADQCMKGKWENVPPTCKVRLKLIIIYILLRKNFFLNLKC